MAMATLSASLLAPKGGAHPAANTPSRVERKPARYPAISRIGPNSKKPDTKKVDIKKVAAAQKANSKKTKKKSLRLSASMDKDLRLLAVRNGLSQQALLELAVSDYLDRAYASGDCVCRR